MLVNGWEEKREEEPEQRAKNRSKMPLSFRKPQKENGKQKLSGDGTVTVWVLRGREDLHGFERKKLDEGQAKEQVIEKVSQ
jgi:hypothetical protein